VKMKTTLRWSMGILLALVLAAGVLVPIARADGIPTSNPLNYAGTLQESGVLVTGTRAITLKLWDDASSTAGANLKCQTISSTTMVTDGRFRMALDTSCTAAVNANPDLYVEVLVGTTSLGRKKLGAVPYAVEAQRASSAAGGLANQIVPSGAVMFFNLASCPPGWTAMVAAEGRYLVGLPPSGMLAGVAGTALTNLENRATGVHGHGVTEAAHSHGISSHTHGISINDPGHSHGVDYVANSGGTFQFQLATGGTPGLAGTKGATTGISASSSANTTGLSTNTGATGLTVNSSTGVAGTVAPYIQLRACQKN
jgi:hypothetical protein